MLLFTCFRVDFNWPGYFYFLAVVLQQVLQQTDYLSANCAFYIFHSDFSGICIVFVALRCTICASDLELMMVSGCCFQASFDMLTYSGCTRVSTVVRVGISLAGFCVYPRSHFMHLALFLTPFVCSALLLLFVIRSTLVCILVAVALISYIFGGSCGRHR